jgi:hypothetical protein
VVFGVAAEDHLRGRIRTGHRTTPTYDRRTQGTTVFLPSNHRPAAGANCTAYSENHRAFKWLTHRFAKAPRSGRFDQKTRATSRELAPGEEKTAAPQLLTFDPPDLLFEIGIRDEVPRSQTREFR